MFCVLDTNNIKIAMRNEEIKEIRLEYNSVHIYYKDGEHNGFLYNNNKEAEESFYDILKQLNEVK